MALYVTRPRRDEVRICRGLPSASVYEVISQRKWASSYEWEILIAYSIRVIVLQTTERKESGNSANISFCSEL